MYHAHSNLPCSRYTNEILVQYMLLYVCFSSLSVHLSQFVEPTGKRFLLAIDVSGSMGSFKVLGATSVTARQASAAMAMVTAKTESNYHMVGFSTNLVPININAKMSLDTVVSTIDRVSLCVLSALTVCSHCMYTCTTNPVYYFFTGLLRYSLNVSMLILIRIVLLAYCFSSHSM